MYMGHLNHGPYLCFLCGLLGAFYGTCCPQIIFDHQPGRVIDGWLANFGRSMNKIGKKTEKIPVILSSPVIIREIYLEGNFYFDFTLKEISQYFRFREVLVIEVLFAP